MTAGVIVVAAVSLIVIIAIRSPSRAEELESFMGPGKIVESASAREGMDMSYWARYRCDPAAVRSYVSKHSYSSRESGTQRLEDFFMSPAFSWPSNFEHFQTDWIVFTVGVGFYRVVAFPDDETDEVFFLEFDT